MFDLIKNININDPLSWQKKTFITIDIDWVIDEVLIDTINLLKESKAKATFFVTHNSDLINELKNNENFELGIHPNFNYLLNGDFRYGKNFKEVIDYYLNLVPTAKSIRSHSLTVNSQILDYISNLGLTHECNLFIPHNSRIELKPFLHWDDKMIRVSHNFEDDVLLLKPEKLHSFKFDESTNELNVFDFHPIHIFLNSNNLTKYEACKAYFNNVSEIKKHINYLEFGMRDVFKQAVKIK